MRKRLDTVTVIHPQTGEQLSVLPMDDGHFDIVIEAGRSWAVTNLRTGVAGGTRVGLRTIGTRAHSGDVNEDGDDIGDVYELETGLGQALIRDAFEEVGLPVRIELRTIALAASLDVGSAVAAVVVAASLKRFAELIIEDGHAYLRAKLQRLRWHGDRVEIRVREDLPEKDSVAAVIEPDLPPQAYVRLQGALPDAPSGKIVFDRESGHWQDSELGL